MRQNLHRFGAARETVRVFVERELVRVQWRVRGRLHTKSWPDSGESRKLARAFAKGIVAERTTPAKPRPLTLRELWTRYKDDQFPHLRPRSRARYTEDWTRWERTWGADFPADDTTLEMVSEFRRECKRAGLAIGTVRSVVYTAKRVYLWGERHELVNRNRIRLYRFQVAKEEREAGPGEFSAEEFAAILNTFGNTNGLSWRPYVALAVCGYQGVRQRSVLNLRWSDIDFDHNVIRWRAEFDKTGREWEQPLRPATIEALRIAEQYRLADSPWVFHSRHYRTGKLTKGETYTAQSLWAALRVAEKRAKIPHQKRRGAHGLRRKLVGDLVAATGDPLLALNAVGDTDVRQAQSYVKRREDRIAGAFKKLDIPEGETKE